MFVASLCVSLSIPCVVVVCNVSFCISLSRYGKILSAKAIVDLKTNECKGTISLLCPSGNFV